MIRLHYYQMGLNPNAGPSRVVIADATGIIHAEWDEPDIVTIEPLNQAERVLQLREAARVLLDAKDRAILGYDDERWTRLREALEAICEI